LKQQRLDASDLTPGCIVRFSRHRRRAGYTQFLTPRAVEPIVSHLREVGAAPVATEMVPPRCELERVLAEYGTHLEQERGLTPAVVRSYQGVAHRFMVERPEPLDFGSLRPRDLPAFVLKESRHYTVGTVKIAVTALRSWLRYLHLTGRVSHELSGAVPAVAGWRMAGLPKALEPHQLQALLAHCQCRTAVGRRDRAAVLLMVRLGLRACEVARLRLEDVRWREAEVVIRGKGRTLARLPMPNDVVAAVTAYLCHARPRSAHRHVFLGSRAPYRPLSVSAVTALVGQAFRRAGLTPAGAHRLRHTAATAMLRGGASLGEVAHVLRHRSLTTTAIYAKVDRRALWQLARPWPGGAR
jgi:site-specific recombinase XerD